MCTVLLPPGVNPIAVNKYININTAVFWSVAVCSLAKVCHTDVSDILVMQEAAGFCQNVNKFLSECVISQATVIFPEQTAAVI
jgi:hypothetical protein